MTKFFAQKLMKNGEVRGCEVGETMAELDERLRRVWDKDSTMPFGVPFTVEADDLLDAYYKGNTAEAA